MSPADWFRLARQLSDDPRLTLLGRPSRALLLLLRLLLLLLGLTKVIVDRLL